MASDLTDFAETIKKLRHSHNHPELGKRIERAEPGAKKAETFLIKMEIKRLSQPVQRRIDLRQISKTDCKQVSKAGVQHYLDEEAVTDFDAEYEQYNNQYTSGVFEYVLSRAKARAKNTNGSLSSKQLPAPAHLSLNKFFQRKDERLYLASKIYVYYRDPNKLDLKERPAYRIEGMTTDISESGLRLKIAFKDYKPLKQLYIQFVGLEQEFELGKKLFVSYRILRNETQAGNALLIVTLDETQPAETIKTCRLVIKKCIHTQRRRNRISVENTIEAVNLKIHEQFINTNMNCLPMLLMQQSNAWLPKTVLLNDSNAGIQQFMQHPSRGFILAHVFANEVIQNRLSSEEDFVSTFFVLRFRDKNKALNFALFRFDEAVENEAIKALLTKGLKQGSVRLFRAHICPIDPLATYHVPSSLPDSAGEAFANLNRVPSKKLTKMVSGFERMCVVCDITSSARLFGFLSSEAEGKAPPVNIRPYLLDVSKTLGNIIPCRVETADSRLEDRFDLQLKVTLTKRRSQSAVEVSGITRNLSSRGLMVDIETSASLSVGEDISVDIDMNFIKQPRVLHKQKYKIVQIEGNRLRLALSGDIASHEARIALREGIADNLDTVKAVGISEPVYGFSKAIRNLFSSNHINLRALTRKQHKEHSVCSLIHSEKTLPITLHADLNTGDGLNMLCAHPTFRAALHDHVSALTDEMPATTFYLLVVARKKRKDSPINLIFKDVPDDITAQEFRFVFANLKTFGSPLFLRINLTQKGQVFDKYYRDELRYLARYARAKHQQLVDDINNTTAVIECQNLTDLVMLVEPDNQADSPLI